MQQASRSAEPLAVVTAVIPVRNRRELTLRCLKQMAIQTYPNLRVVVVDSNSSDGTPEAVRAEHPDVLLLQATDQDYWAGATNLGVRQALALGSDWLLTINDDAVIGAAHVEQLLAIAQRHGCRILGSQINHLADCERIWSLGTQINWGTADLIRLGCHGRMNNQIRKEIGGEEVIKTEAMPGNGVLIHASVFDQIGLYNDRFLPHYHADSELVMRAVAAGITAWVTPELILLNDFSPDQKLLPLKRLKGIIWSIAHPKSHLYLPPLAYIWARYCPSRQKPSTALALLRRFWDIFINKNAKT